MFSAAALERGAAVPAPEDGGAGAAPEDGGANVPGWEGEQSRRTAQDAGLETESLQPAQGPSGAAAGRLRRPAAVAAWCDRLELLRAYVEAHECLPPRVCNYHGVNLGKWISRQCQSKAENRLAPWQIVALEGMPGWRWSTSHNDTWESHFRAFHDYCKTFNHLPRSGVVYQGVNLGSWMQRQRRRADIGRLAPERAAALAGVSGWKW
jgi:hypothetical protein